MKKYTHSLFYLSILGLTGCATGMRGNIGDFATFLAVVFLILAIIFAFMSINGYGYSDEAGTAGLVATALFILMFTVA